RFPAPALLNHVMPAAWARVRRRPLPAGKPAVGITAAAVKDAAPPGAALHHLALAALGARDADLVEQRPRVLALRVARARQELAEAPPLDHQVAAALLANLVGD